MLDDAKPITSVTVDDQRFEWLMMLSKWLQAWKQYSTSNKTEILSKETYTSQRLRNFYLSNKSNLNVSPESTVSDHSKTGFIFDIAPLLKKLEQNNL